MNNKKISEYDNEKDLIESYIAKLEVIGEEELINKINKKWEEEFDEKKELETWNDGFLDEQDVDWEKVESFIDQKITQQREEIVNWAQQRCEDNLKTFGTDKWNGDLEDLIEKLK